MPDKMLDGVRPAWSSIPISSARPVVRGPKFGLLVGAMAAPLLSAALLPYALTGWRLYLAFGTLFAVSVILFLAGRQALRHVRLLDQALEHARHRNDALFQRTGISLWHEDWSAARDTVSELSRSGISDVQSYYTQHPDELRSLRKRVTIKNVNEFAVQMMGASTKADLIGPLDNILPDTDHTFMQWLVAIARGDRYYRSETHILRPDGTAVDTLFTAEIPKDPAGFEDIVVSALDISGYKADQERLASAERDVMRAARVTTMGALSASIAHEVNSPLAAIVSHAEASLRWLRRPIPDLEEAAIAIESVVVDASRARDVVQRTRAYLSNSPSGMEPVDVADAARNAILLVERELRDNDISVHFDADESLPSVLGDRVQIQQVLVNLMLNSAQAMTGRSGPRDLTIIIRGHAGREIVAQVKDVGPGIPADQAPLIFEPFYTNREDGMGMGLAICRTVIEAHNGRISLESGAGATFQFRLPVAAQ